MSHQYVIKSGDTLFEIAKTNDTTVNALEAANPGVNPTNLHIGESIKLPSNESSKDGTSKGHGTGGSEAGKGYINYSGSATNYPKPSEWATFSTLVSQNKRLMKLHDTDEIITLVIKAIEQVSHESGVDARAILCTVMQESNGDPKVTATNNGVRNPGLMQSHNGAVFNPKDPAGSILQMIRDGTEGTKDGDGLKQLVKRYGNYYEAFRAYNSGSVDKRDLNDALGATESYVRDMANRLMVHEWPKM
ncbi:hypothetical protein BDV97DRAFT_360083 [Delphinella strobiligena]|nr:hypothetical protein BDV97DRAFT_360083 [Delphinella strobiligena]